MCSVRGRKGVIDIKVAERGEALGELAIVFLLALVIPNVLEHGDLAGLKRIDHALRVIARRSGGEGTAIPGISSCILAATGRSEVSGVGWPLGRPRWDRTTTLAPSRATLAMVGRTRVSRVGSATTPFSIGTLKSTRTSTRLPLTSTSSIDLTRERSRPSLPEF